MKILKNKLLGIVNTENELEFDENPFVRLIRINNTVYYFRGLYMKLWATGPVLYKTLKINKSYSFSYGRGVIRNSDGQETIQTINFISDGKRDSDGYLAFTPSSDAYGIPMDTVVFRVKEGSTPDKIWLKTPTGTTEDETINPVSFSTIDTMSTATMNNSQSWFFNDGNDMNVVYIPTSDYVSSGTIVTDIYTRTVYLDNDTEPLEWSSLLLEYEDATCQISNETFQYTLYYEI